VLPEYKVFQDKVVPEPRVLQALKVLLVLKAFQDHLQDKVVLVQQAQPDPQELPD
jgi:hypothetical protein